MSETIASMDAKFNIYYTHKGEELALSGEGPVEITYDSNDVVSINIIPQLDDSLAVDYQGTSDGPFVERTATVWVGELSFGSIRTAKSLAGCPDDAEFEVTEHYGDDAVSVADFDGYDITFSWAE